MKMDFIYLLYDMTEWEIVSSTAGIFITIFVTVAGFLWWLIWLLHKTKFGNLKSKCSIIERELGLKNASIERELSLKTAYIELIKLQISTNSPATPASGGGDDTLIGIEGWLGGTDAAAEGEWRWIKGAEVGDGNIVITTMPQDFEQLNDEQKIAEVEDWNEDLRDLFARLATEEHVTIKRFPETDRERELAKDIWFFTASGLMKEVDHTPDYITVTSSDAANPLLPYVKTIPSVGTAIHTADLVPSAVPKYIKSAKNDEDNE